MKLAEAIFAKLSADSAVAAIVGTRIYANRAEQAAQFPYVVFTMVSSIPDQTHGEASELDSTLVQFSCYASTYHAARDLRQAVRAALENQTLSDGIKPIIDISRDQYEEAASVHHLIVDVSFWNDPAAV